MTNHRIGTREVWLAAREQLLAREKEHTRLGDELAQHRRDLPWVPVDKEYRFDTKDGEKTLTELFDGRSQLLVYHFMFGPNYEAGDPVNSSIADAVDAVLPHLHARDVTFAFVSQAPLEKIQAYKRRMGWSFPWVSSSRTDFNFDLGFSHYGGTGPRGRGADDGERATADSRTERPARPAPISVATSPRALDSARSYTTTAPFTTRTRRRGVDWNFSWATTRSSTMHRRVAMKARRGSSGSVGTTSTRASDERRLAP
jgi:hypothetical protein